MLGHHNPLHRSAPQDMPATCVRSRRPTGSSAICTLVECTNRCGVNTTSCKGAAQHTETQALAARIRLVHSRTVDNFRELAAPCGCCSLQQCAFVLCCSQASGAASLRKTGISQTASPNASWEFVVNERVYFRALAFADARAAAARPRPPTPIGRLLPLCLGSIRLNMGAFLSMSGTITKRIRLPLMNRCSN
jgi:hypothetical protein